MIRIQGTLEWRFSGKVQVVEDPREHEHDGKIIELIWPWNIIPQMELKKLFGNDIYGVPYLAFCRWKLPLDRHQKTD